MTSAPAGRPGSFPGWILVLALLLLCGTGTWLTWWNYSRNVFSSTGGIVLERGWPETRIAVVFPGDAARAIRPGHSARVTVAGGTKALGGEVVGPAATDKAAASSSSVIVRLLDEPPALPGVPSGWDPHWLPAGTVCSVTVDTTIPPFSRSAKESPPPSTLSPSR